MEILSQVIFIFTNLGILISKYTMNGKMARPTITDNFFFQIVRKSMCFYIDEYV